MMMFDRMLRSGVWLRRRKKWLPMIFIASVIFALLVTPPFTIIKNTAFLTIISILAAVCGMWVRYLAMQTKSRSLPDMIQAEGIYSVVRFPFYLSNILIMLALTLYVGIVWYTVSVVLIGWIVAEKIILNEENALQNKYGTQFTQWSKRTSCLIPNFVAWNRSQYSAPKKETVCSLLLQVLLIVAGFSIINLLKNIMIYFSFRVGYVWLAALLIIAVFYLFSRLVPKESKSDENE